MVPLFLLMHYHILSINGILVLPYIPCSLASHRISTDLSMKSDSDQSIEGDVKRRDCIKKKLPKCRFFAVLDRRGKVLSGMDPLLSILISRKWTEPCKINCSSVGFYVILELT